MSITLVMIHDFRRFAPEAPRPHITITVLQLLQKQLQHAALIACALSIKHWTLFGPNQMEITAPNFITQ